MSSSQRLASLRKIAEVILNEASPATSLHKALDDYSLYCSKITGIVPDPGFDGWADDTYLEHGVAINPRAAAFCIKDYQRSVVFIRGLYAATQALQKRFSKQSINILYAGCGPFATLMLPLMSLFKASEIELYLVDIHQQSLDSVKLLLEYFGLTQHKTHSICADACSYLHGGTLHIIIAETMQKSLEQEPQFMVTKNLAPQLCPEGIFIPQAIDVELCLAHLKDEQSLFEHENTVNHDSLVNSGRRHRLARLLTLTPQQTTTEHQQAKYNAITNKYELAHQRIEIPAIEGLSDYDALIFTRIQVYDSYKLGDYESEISLPYPCNDFLPLKAGAAYESCYELGSYPRFNFRKI